MNKSIYKAGFRLLGISLIYRLISFVYFSFSWQWPNLFTRSIDIILAVVFLLLWFLYGFKKKLGIKRGMAVGVIGVCDGFLLQLITLFAYLFRGSHYFGPVTMIPWVIPFLGASDMFDFLSGSACFLPIIAFLLVTAGSYVGSIYNRKKVIALSLAI